MSGSNDLRDERETNSERTSADIREDIAKGEASISDTVDQISDRLKEKLEWRGYVRDYPALAMGAAAGLGFLAAGLIRKRPSPTERIIGSIAHEVRDSLGGPLVGGAGPGLIKVTLLGLATKVAANWIKAAVTAGDRKSGRQRPPMEGRFPAEPDPARRGASGSFADSHHPKRDSAQNPSWR